MSSSVRPRAKRAHTRCSSHAVCVFCSMHGSWSGHANCCASMKAESGGDSPLKLVSCFMLACLRCWLTSREGQPILPAQFYLLRQW
eukprot:175042-Amphidinium_carterae.1